MENPSNAATASSARIDYGSTALNGSNIDCSPHDTNVNANGDDFALTTGFSSQSVLVGYQNVSQTASSTNLFSKPPSHRTQDSFAVLASRLTRMPADSKPNTERRQMLERCEFLLNVLNQMCIGFVTIYLSWQCLHLNLAGTALHAWLVTIGFSFLMAEAIMCHYNGNVLTYNYKRNTKTTIHWVLQVLGGGLGVAGGFIKCVQKGFKLKSTHGQLGFAALILCLISLVSGLAALYSTRVKKFLSPLLNKTFHNLLGLATFVIALVAQYYGYETGFFRHKISTDFQGLMKLLTLISLVLTCIGPLKGLYNKCVNFVRTFR